MPYFRRGSLQDRIGRFGLLGIDEVLAAGVKMCGALESPHRLGIVHRDVKPANIMLTDYGEPALTDFGIAHLAGTFTTSPGILSGTPAFMAPEVLTGDPPSAASDVYALGATLFAALTGRPPFERRKGEPVAAQLLRIASDPIPDLGERGIPPDVGAVVEHAMCREPADRPSAWDVGVALRQLQAQRGTVVDAMTVPESEETPRTASLAIRAASAGSGGSGVPAPLSSMVGRRRELVELQTLLSSSRLVTLIGVGGVGKTTLAMHASRESLTGFADGVWLVELADLRDDAPLAEAATAAVGLRDDSARSPIDALVEFLQSRQALLVLDNCEHLSTAAADFVEMLLRNSLPVGVFAMVGSSLADHHQVPRWNLH